MIGGLSMTEVIIILGLALLLLGPDQLPVLAKSLGKGLKELRKATDDIKGQFEQEMARVDLDQTTPRIMAPVPPPVTAAGSTTPGAQAVAQAAEDPGAARAAARRAAADAQLKLVKTDEPAAAAPKHHSINVEPARIEQPKIEPPPEQPKPAEASPAEAAPVEPKA
ncbi:MAG TPA: twin-arginine translocase TatA/TatE family subunit [Myxococcales bacterium]|nr:twin-arginine translocase TatA/TatE family subunit [Myxococcales bacterium]